MPTATTAGATEKSLPTASGTAATFNVELAKPGAKMTYDLVVVNNGTIDATFNEITGIDELNTAEPKAITYKAERLDSANGSPVTGSGDLLAKGKNYFRVTVEWPAHGSNTVPTETTSKTGTIYLDMMFKKQAK